MQPYKTPSAIILVLERNVGGKKQILLQRRRNTGFADGLWDFACAGKVEEGETLAQTVVREAREELGICVSADELNFLCLVHKRDEQFNLTYYNAYFGCTEFVGEPKICESEKCSDLRWFDSDNLPDDLIEDRRQAYKTNLNGVHYLEYGWSR